MFEKFSRWIAISMIVLLVLVGVVPQSAHANPAETDPPPETEEIDPLLCWVIGQGQPIDDKYGKYYLKQNKKNEIPANGSIKATFYGTTMLLLDDGETKILIDAHLTRPYCATLVRSINCEITENCNAKLLKTSKYIVDKWLNRPEVGEPNAIFIAHSHHDHALDAPYIAKQTGATLYGSKSTANIARGKCRSGSLLWGAGEKPCVSEDKIKVYEDLKQPVEIGKFTVTVLPGEHSPVTPGFPEDLGIPIEDPLEQPAKTTDYTEGGSYSFVIKHGTHSIMLNLAQPEDAALDGVQADVLFLATPAIKAEKGTEGADKQFYDLAVGKVQPDLVIPLHWDNFMKPLTDNLVPFGVPSENPNSALDSTFDFLINRLEADDIEFGIMQGYQSVMLFND